MLDGMWLAATYPCWAPGRQSPRTGDPDPEKSSTWLLHYASPDRTLRELPHLSRALTRSVTFTDGSTRPRVREPVALQPRRPRDDEISLHPLTLGDRHRPLPVVPPRLPRARGRLGPRHARVDDPARRRARRRQAEYGPGPPVRVRVRRARADARRRLPSGGSGS